MHIQFKLKAWEAIAPGLNNKTQWLSDLSQQNFYSVVQKGLFDKPTHTPMMSARRMNQGSLQAVECALRLLCEHEIDAIIFTSRHGELEKQVSILTAISKGLMPSPADFSASVHNAAAGLVSIITKKNIIVSAISAGINSFNQGLIEAYILLQTDYQRVMIIDAEGRLPEMYRDKIMGFDEHFPYAVAYVLEKTDCSIAREIPAPSNNLNIVEEHNRLHLLTLPESIKLLLAYISDLNDTSKAENMILKQNGSDNLYTWIVECH